MSGKITYPFPHFNGRTVEVWEWMSNFTSRFIMDVITYLWWDQSYSMLVKGTPLRHALCELAKIVMHKAACYAKFLDINYRIYRSRNQCLSIGPSSAIIAQWYALIPQVDPAVDHRRINTGRADGYTWWRHSMETLSELLTFCDGSLPVSGGFYSQRASNVE